MSRVTVVCCYNDADQFMNLKKGISEQSEEAELIGIDNTEGTGDMQ